MVWDLTVRLVGHQDKLQALLLFLQLRDLSLQFRLLLLQYVRLLWAGTENEKEQGSRGQGSGTKVGEIGEGGKKMCSRKREDSSVSYAKLLLQCF